MMAAFALKVFSASSQTKRLYRFLGNTLRARKRARMGLQASHLSRAEWFLGLFDRYGIVENRQGARLLELGTGWVHWDATVLRLFHDVDVTLFDVWDNRQLQTFKTCFAQFADVFGRDLQVSELQRERAQKLLAIIAAVNSFDELYDSFGFRYVIEPTGTLQSFQDESFDALFSFNVLEHVGRGIIAGYVKDLYRLLRPKGYSMHGIDISDHLAHYDRSVCHKNYLRFSDSTWRRVFENDVQYFNRVQRGQWLRMFSKAGFELLEEESVYQPIHTRIHSEYAALDRQDIECVQLKIIHRKPYNMNPKKGTS
jgi:SAM-dependent methyltransferase